MSNPFEITITLKQHTPLIHFQHEQAGAILRATELKPKLDKFILSKGFVAWLIWKDFDCLWPG